VQQVPVRGTSHAILQKKCIILEGAEAGTNILCAWADCSNDGLMLYRVRVNDAKPGFKPQYYNFLFCCEKHKQYHLHSSNPEVLWGHLPSGAKGQGNYF